MKVRCTLTVCVDGVEMGHEFDAEEETVEAVGEATWQKMQNPDSVVTLLVGPPRTVTQ